MTIIGHNIEYIKAPRHTHTSLTLRESADIYARHLVETGRRETTVGTYRKMILRCCDELEDEFGELSPENVGPEHIHWLFNSFDMTEASIKCYLSVFGQCMAWCFGNNPVHDADILWNSAEHKRKFITVEDWRRMLEGAGVRDRLILLLGGMMGLRRFEMSSIRLTDISGRTLTIHGKGHGRNGKIAYREMPQPVLDALDAYMIHRERILRESGDRSEGHLLVRETYMKGEPMNPEAVATAVRSLANSLGIDATVHSLRRLYATTLYDLGTDLQTLKTLMRHASIETTLTCYINANPRLQREAMDALERSLI